MKEELLAAATTLIQEVGVNGFSYNLLAERIGIKAPSIHHHFKRKEDLVAAAAAQFRIAHRTALAELEHDTVEDLLRAYASIFGQVANANRMCLCGAVASDWAKAGELPRLEVEGFFEDQLVWLSTQIQRGSESGELRADLDPRATAHMLLAALEGALLLKRAAQSADPADMIADLLLTLMAPTAA